MEYVKLCDSDYRFMCVVWEHAPINSGELVKLCQEQLGWKKSTTYTVVRKMCEKGYIANEDATVSVLIPKEQVRQRNPAILWTVRLTDHARVYHSISWRKENFQKRSKAAQENDRRA